jgi:hypothetical protein
MKSRLASSFLVLAFIALAFVSAPVFAQGRSGGSNGVAGDLAALAARVAKLEGQIVASDLAGTYSVIGLSSTMSALKPGVQQAMISTGAIRATLTLNANGTGQTSNISCEGSTLTQGPWTLIGEDCSEPGTGVTWTYAGGVVTITFLSDGDTIPFNVGLGGRLLINAFAGFHGADDPPSSDQFVLIATRLR